MYFIDYKIVNILCINRKFFISYSFLLNMAKPSIRLPGSFGGIQRYSEEYKSKFQIKPMHVVIIIAIVAATALILKFLVKL